MQDKLKYNYFLNIIKKIRVKTELKNTLEIRMPGAVTNKREKHE